MRDPDKMKCPDRPGPAGLPNAREDFPRRRERFCSDPLKEMMSPVSSFAVPPAAPLTSFCGTGNGGLPSVRQNLIQAIP